MDVIEQDNGCLVLIVILGKLDKSIVDYDWINL